MSNHIITLQKWDTLRVITSDGGTYDIAKADDGALTVRSTEGPLSIEPTASFDIALRVRKVV